MATLKADSIRKATDPGRYADGGGLFLSIAKADLKVGFSESGLTGGGWIRASAASPW